MDTTPTGSHESAKEADERGREAAGAASDAASEIQKDLQALRDDFRRLVHEIGGIVSSKRDTAWRGAKTSVDGAVSNAQDKGREAVGAVREVTDYFAGAIDESIKKRPYTTLALAACLGFILGAKWRR